MKYRERGLVLLMVLLLLASLAASAFAENEEEAVCPYTTADMQAGFKDINTAFEKYWCPWDAEQVTNKDSTGKTLYDFLVDVNARLITKMDLMGADSFKTNVTDRLTDKTVYICARLSKYYYANDGWYVNWENNDSPYYVIYTIDSGIIHYMDIAYVEGEIVTPVGWNGGYFFDEGTVIWIN